MVAVASEIITRMEKSMAENNPKLKLLYLMKILLEKTDETHAITMPEILQSLRAYGISAERKSIYTDVENLRTYGLDIVGEQKDRTFYYHVGNRQFELAELKLLVDSVQSARFITEKKSQALIKKIEGLASTYEASELQTQVYVTERVKSENEKILYNIDAIHSAIVENSVITFKYFNWNEKKEMVLRHNGELYEISPFALTLFDENYYLVSYDKAADCIKYFRVDKMLDINLTGAKREGIEVFRRFDIAAYSKKRFGMYDGEEKLVKLLVNNDYAGVIIDRFGKDVLIQKADDSHIHANVNVAVSNQFFGWVVSMNGAIKVVGPESVVEGMKQFVKKAYETYM